MQSVRKKEKTLRPGYARQSLPLEGKVPQCRSTGADEVENAKATSSVLLRSTASPQGEAGKRQSQIRGILS